MPEPVPAGVAPAAVDVPPEPRAAVEPPVAGGTALDVPLDLVDPRGVDAETDAAVVTHADAVRGLAGWPCHGCGETVPLDRDACPVCATPFLAGAEVAVSTALPVVGDLRALSAGGRVALMAGGAVLVAGVFVLLFLVLGQFV